MALPSSEGSAHTLEPPAFLALLDSPDEFRRALEQALVGPELSRLVEELEGLQRERPAIAVALAPDLRQRILDHGLQPLADDDFRLVLHHARLLFTLQKAVLTEGGPYWDEVIRRPQQQEAEARSTVELPEREFRVQLLGRPWYACSGAWVANAVTGIAAAVIVYVAVQRTPPTPAPNRSTDLAAAQPFVGPAIVVPPEQLPEFEITKAHDPLDLPEGDPDDLPGADPRDLPA